MTGEAIVLIIFVCCNSFVGYFWWKQTKPRICKTLREFPKWKDV